MIQNNKEFYTNASHTLNDIPLFFPKAELSTYYFNHDSERYFDTALTAAAGAKIAQSHHEAKAAKEYAEWQAWNKIETDRLSALYRSRHKVVVGVPTSVIPPPTLVRVGQWMSKKEFETFQQNGKIPRTNVLTKGSFGYYKQASVGDFYIEFDIDASLLVPKNDELGWMLVKSKNLMYLKLSEKKGVSLPKPIGKNIEYIETK